MSVDEECKVYFETTETENPTFLKISLYTFSRVCGMFWLLQSIRNTVILFVSPLI